MTQTDRPHARPDIPGQPAAALLGPAAASASASASVSGSATAEPVITVDTVTKRFVQRRKAGLLHRQRTVFTAVDQVSFTIAAGELIGYIGPNGAGKSTTIKMLTGILMPTSGQLTVAGLTPQRDRVKLARQIGVVFGQRTSLWWDLPLGDSFALLQRLYRVPPARFRANLDKYVQALDLGPLLDKPVRQLSLGQRMRGDITAALLHDPMIIYLDEPTIGLDIVSKKAVREFLHTLNVENGTTILLTTHDIGDIERLCSRVIAIDHGRVGFDGTLDQLRAGRDLETAVTELYLGGLDPEAATEAATLAAAETSASAAASA
ncbi:MAG TPA: ATP-binding cassette domain-containing protein [Actinocrinis sp.]|nr:ATP-binding cassette domain-containing protein [Actinocrinis sp.]